MLWDLFQQSQIRHSQNSADNAEMKASIANSKIEELEGQLQTLSLACQAMWELVSPKFGIAEQELLTKMDEIDLRDGTLDGKLQTTTHTKCPDCGHEVKRKRPNCFRCGANFSGSTPFIK